MREILFRGKCVDTGVWYEGGYIHLHKTTHCPIGDPDRFHDNDIHQIVFERMTDWELPNQHLRVDVNPETVGQFTGLTDKNGKKIFEGDILKDDWGKIYKVFYTTKSCSFMVECTVTPNEWETGNYRIGEAWRETIRVIGNIHDNQELL